MTIAYALVVAAGRGQRLGGEVPKQYLPLAGVPVLRRSLDAFLGHPGIAGARVVFHPDDRDRYAAAVAGLDLPPPVAGGATRQQSVLNGLESLAEFGPDVVLIHDAARPLVSRDIIDRTLAALDRAPGAVGAVRGADTVKRDDGAGRVAATVDRAGLWRAQTPQAFRYGPILAAHRAAAGRDGGATDDAAIAEAAGLPVAIVPGSEDNFKITTAEDLRRAERLLGAAWEYRTGTGFDVHRFAAGDGVMLCGVRVPHDRGLEGHSDADAGLHAITDALLGAIAAEDIGTHFPPRDERWRGADSARFLAHAARLVAECGGRVVHVDVTLVCERPKIAPHRAAMVARIAEILGIDPGRVSVKATTTEGLGFAGRREGIAAQAAATVALPAAL
ncbi:MAG: bifunctional 2-C-methyl-D-erythritol 4-phosphate cytidylyltransferase/2-C-methyl-D-erythritol 2,4-cyclodiphosphate synthase [Rhodospirillaceae bacterium]|nr:bifunctional 2-C-methyl-D-erythritol 4-phosphate cytidylyltransferase/2-C-methyl-D-erythritol 2,4-cyclodiphosphate synthase [Rhodospirillaceae bacterium]